MSAHVVVSTDNEWGQNTPGPMEKRWMVVLKVKTMKIKKKHLIVIAVPAIVLLLFGAIFILG